MTQQNETQQIPIDSYGADIDFCVRVTKIATFIVTKLLRCDTTPEQFQHLDFNNSGIILCNHSNGLWGAIDVLMSFHYWYGLLKKREPLAFMSDHRVFQVPVIGSWMRRLGFKISSVQSLANCLKDNNWALMPSGGNTDQLKSIWQRTHARFYKTVYRNGAFKEQPQTWFLRAAAMEKVTIYPFAVAGAHEMTPILWESQFILKYSGLIKLRAGEYWPGFPVSLNHIVNLALFYASGYMSSGIAWVLFIFSNIYLDFFYSYPIFFPKLRSKPVEPVKVYFSSDSLSHKQMGKECLPFLHLLSDRLSQGMHDLDELRSIVKHLPRTAPKYRLPPVE